MRKPVLSALTLLAALTAVVAMPWLAWREAQRQAYDAEAEITLAYAKDVLYRAEETGRQVRSGLERLHGAAHDPCSAAALELMHHIDLTSTYIQAIGHVRDGALACSSTSSRPIALGPKAYRTSTGFDFYLEVPVQGAENTLMAIGDGRFAALIHRDLPLDIGAAKAGIALAVLHPERSSRHPMVAAHGNVDGRWLARLGNRQSLTFVDGRRLVAVVRSREFLFTAVAAVPLARMEQRAGALAGRLLPAGVAVGLALAAAIVLLAREQRSLAAAMRTGLRRDEFFLEYQPIVDLATGRWVGAEALLRWRRPTGESIGPDLFIPVAEQTGLIHQLTRRVLELAERDAGAFLGRRPDFHLALNLSPADLRGSAIVPHLDALLARTGAAPANLLVEITEHGFLDLDSARGTIAALRERGIAVAIDDFGTGYSSLSYLERLQVDFLKIDRSFITTIGTGAPTSQVVGHIISMADTMGLRMIAEGVERPEQADFLRDRQVPFAQGWLFARPMAFARIEQAVAQQAAATA